MPQPIAYNAGLPISGSIQENNISYVVDGQQRNYRGGFGGLSWMSEVPPANNLIFIGNSTSIGRGPANIPLFYPAYNNSSANIVYAANTLPGSPRNFTTTASAYNWAVTNNFFINNSDNPIPRIDADGLALYLDANQASSYPQTGTTWYDLSGYGSSQVLYNAPPFSTDGYFNFSTNEYSIRSGGGTLTLGDNYTISATVNILNNTATFRTLVRTLPDDHPILINSGNNSLGYFANGDGNFLDSGYSITAGVWMRIDAVGINGTQQQFYINGNAVGSPVSSTSGKNATGMTWDAFGNVNGGSQPFGKVSNCVVYNKALTTSEIKQNYFQSNIVQDGLVFMVDANNIVSYEGSGTTAYSLTGSNTGTLTNGVGFSNSNGGTWVFDGVDDTISVAYNTAMDPTGGITLEAWIYPEDLTTIVFQEIFRKESGGGRQLFSFQNNGTIISFGTDTTGNGYDELDISINPLNYTNKWCHFVASYTSGYKAIYIDGQLIGLNTGVTGNLIQGNAVYFIGSASGGSEFFNGGFANFKMYSRGLTSTEIQQNYQATEYKFLGPQIVTNGLVLNLDAANKDSYPGTGTTWTDLSGNGNNGTLTNGPSFLPNVNSGVLSLDGVDDHVIVSNVFNFGSSNAMTAEIWAKSDNATWNDFGYLISRRNQFIIHPQYTSTEVYFYIFSGGYHGVAITPTSITGFNQYVLTYNNGDLRAYLNGSLGNNASVSSPIASYSGNTFIGKDDFLSRFLDGSVGAVRLYNRALSATEVAQNYNATKGRFGL